MTVAHWSLDICLHTLLIAVALFALELIQYKQWTLAPAILATWIVAGFGRVNQLWTRGLQRVFRVGPTYTYHKEKESGLCETESEGDWVTRKRSLVSVRLRLRVRKRR